MATAKKKTTAKSSAAKANVKYAAKNQSYTKAASASQSAARSGAEWVKSGAAEWQKGAQDWAKQSAKLYQFPFAQDEATQAAKSATEGMMNFAQQMFNQSKNSFSADSFNPASMFKAAPQLQNFNPQDAQEKLSRFAQESADQLNKSAGSAQRAASEAASLLRENGEVLVEVTNLAVSVSKEVAAEFISYLNKSFAQNVEIGKQVHNCRTLNDLFDLASTCMKANLDGFFSESIKLSEKLFRSATEISEPLNERLSDTTERLTKVMAS